jgi:hypothetical protein
MANKPFAIQGSDLTLGGVNLSAGTTGVVIPGVTQAVNFRVKEVDEMPNIGGQDLGSDETAVTVIDNAEYLYLVDDGDSPSADYVAATYSVDELDELGNIKEIDVETEGVFLTADKSRAEAANMWATLDPTPFVSFSAGNWTQIPFRPKMRAGEVENVGGGNADTGNFTFNEDTITNSDGMKLTTNRGTLAMGTNMETPGVAQHFHIAFDGSNSNPPASDLFLGDDNNYVKLPGYELNPTAQFGVEIGTDNRNLGPQNIEVGTVDELAPPGGVWRLFIDHDTYPNLGSAVSVGDTVTTSWGTPITATITAVIEESGNWWKIHVAQNITAGFSGGDTVSFGSPADSYTWRFGTDGVLTLPNAMTIDASVSFGIVTIGGDNTEIRIDDGGAPPGLYIRTDMAGADHGWLFGPDGDITFPDGTIQTTAYTGQNSGGNTIVRYVAVHSNGIVYGSSDGENWTPYTSIMDNIDKVAVGPTNIVYVADRTVGSGESLWYATAYNATPVEVAPSEGVVEYYNEVKYFSSIGKYIAVGHVEGGEGSDDVPLLLHSSDGVTWTRSYVDQGLLSESDPGDVEFTDIAENALGFFIVSDENQLGSFFLENITDALDATTLVDQADDYEHVIWVETAAAGFRGWHVFDDDQDWYYNANEDPRVGSFALFDFEDLDDIFEAALGYSDDPSEIVVGDYNGVSTIVIGTGDGQIMRWPATAATPTVVIPKPYTATISAWTSAVESVITYTGKEATSSNEKFTVSGSSVTAYNGTYYIDDNNNKVYTDLALTMPFDTTGLSAFTGTATITWSHGQYIDALHYSNGIFYVGNDSEEFFISTDGGATWTETDAFTDDNNPDSGYIDDIDSYSTATTTTNKLINGTQEFTLNANGSVTFPDGSIQTTAYTGGDLNTWVQTFESANPLQDIPLIALSVEYDSVGNVIALFYHSVEEGGSYYSVGKYTASGTRIWTTRFDTDYETDGWGLAVDLTSGFIYVAGKTNANGGQQKSTLTKIAGGGSVEWSNTYAFGVSINSNSQVVDVASDGNPVMVGYAVAGADTGYVTTTKVDAEDGSIIWSKKLDGQGDEEAYGMAVGPSGEVVAVGYMDQLGLGSTNAVATVVTAPSSNVNWTTQYGGGNGINQNYQGIIFDIIVTDGVPAITIKTDPVGNRTIGDTIMTLPGDSFGGVNGVDDMIVNVASVSSTAGSEDNHMLVVKYNSAGAIQWQKAILFDAGLDSTGADADIDSEGNVYVCGQYEANEPTVPGICMNLVKFNSAGVKQWSRRVEGDCGSIATSIVVGADDKLYLSGSLFTTTVPNPGPGDPIDISCVVAKYNLDGTVAWQRLLDNTDALSISGSDFLSSQGGGSNLAVKQDYVALAGGFGPDTDPGDFRALIAQLPAAGDLFTVGAWDFKASSLTGILNTGASDITVVDADKTNTDNISNITVATVTPAVDSSNFLIGTLYSAPGSNNSLVNNGNQLILESTGTLTLPQGGTITEGYVTSNPTIQLTPADPDVASQKLVIKGGGSYSNTENGIYLSTYNITWAVSDTVEFNVYDPTRTNETLYWWIVPEGAGISTTMSGTVTLDGIGDGTFTFTLDSDAYEFRVRVSPEDNNYDPNNTGVESVLINGDEPTFEGEHHLHLTTGDLTETSIFLGTDDHNVRTTTNGKIQITTPNTVNKVWEFDTAGTITLPQGGVISETYANDGHSILLTPYAGLGNNPDMAVKIYPTFNDDDHIHITAGNPATVDLFLGDDDQYVKIEADGGNIVISADDPADVKWTFGTNGKLSKLGGVTLTAGGQFNICTIVNPGSGYTGDDPLPATTTTTGNGTGMTVNFGYGIAGQLTSVDVSNPGTGYVNGDVISVAGGSGNFILTQYNVLGNQANSNFAQSEWTFSPDGGLTFPNSTVQTTAYTGITTVAKTGTIPATVGTRLVTGFTIEPTYDAGWVNSYSVSIAGFSCDINFPSAGNPVFGNIVDTAGNRTVGDILTTVLASNIGGTVDMVLKVGAVSEIVVATAIDLTKSVNKLTDGVYTLANGVEGQIMYLVAQNGVVEANVSVLVANSRNIGVGTLSPFSVYDNSDDSYYDNIGGICTLIFTDGAWQQSGGAWGTPT